MYPIRTHGARIALLGAIAATEDIAALRSANAADLLGSNNLSGSNRCQRGIFFLRISSPPEVVARKRYRSA